MNRINPKNSDQKIEEYLRMACRWVFSPRQKKNVKLELSSHIETAIEVKCLNGMSHDLAVESALNEMGPVKELSRQLGFAHRPLVLRLHFLTATFVFGLFIGTISLVELTSRLFHQSAINQAEILNTYQARFLSDEEHLSADPIFAMSGQLRDAGPTLNPIIVWSGSDRKEIHSFFPEHSPLEIDKETTKSLHRKEWLQTQIDSSKFDTAWMHQLAGFDHWNIFDSGPVDKLFNANPSQDFWSMPIPDYTNLQYWVKLRLLQGIQSKNPLKALQDVRALARLVYSNQFLISNVIAVIILEDEKSAFELALKKGFLRPGAWQPIATTQAIRARRALWAFPGVFDLWTDSKTLSLILDGKVAKAGMCAAVQERLWGMSLSREMHENDSFYSTDFEARFQQLDQVFNRIQTQCVISKHLVEVWRNPSLTLPWLRPESFHIEDLTDAERFKWQVLARLPIFKGWLAAYLEENSRPNYFHGYQKWLITGEAKLPD